ncbi:MAG: hypothetical protein J6I66_06995 [Lachnospiraceae bacterium]|nr:hypothetical protein [Lachnospiraceae bacterium]
MDSGKQTVSISFNELPKNLAQLQALPESSLDTPFKTAALTVCALCAYPSDKDAAIEMLNFLKGPQPLSPYDIQFLRDRFMDGKTYVPVSYFKGAVPGNNYVPSEPFTIEVFSNPYSYDNEGYAKLYIRSGGADTERPITLRKRGSDGKWFLWEQMLLADIRKPVAADPWA